MRPLNKEEEKRLEIRSKEYQNSFIDIVNKEEIKSKTVGSISESLSTKEKSIVETMIS